MKYDEKVEKMSVAIHESWERSRNTIMNDYVTPTGMKKIAEKLASKGKITRAVADDAIDAAPKLAPVMHAKWDGFMIPFADLDEPVKEYDRMEARQALAMTGALPIYTTRQERSSLKACINNLGNGKYKNGDEARARCFRDLNLHCKPQHRSGNDCDPYKT